METKKMTYMQAVRLALDEEFARDEKVIMMGQDIGILGGAYGVTGDLYHKYGPDRVIDAPLAENAIVGFGIGTAMTEYIQTMKLMGDQSAAVFSRFAIAEKDRFLHKLDNFRIDHIWMNVLI